MKASSPTVVSAVFALVLTLAVAVAVHLPFGRGLEAWTSDKMVTWRYQLLKRLVPAGKLDPHLVFVAIDQQSVSDLGRWPFPRGIHGQFLQVLAPAQPRVVAWDVLFTELTTASPTNDAPPVPAGAPPPLQADDQALVESAKLLPRMVTAALGDSSNGLTLQKEAVLPTRPLKNVRGNLRKIVSFPYAIIPFPQLRKVSYFGFVDANPNDAQRNIPLVVAINGKIFPAFDLQILMQYWGASPDQVMVDLDHEITLPRADGTWAHIPIDAAGQIRVNYRGRINDFRSMSYSLMGKGLADVANGQASEERSHLPPLRNNIVVLGVTLSGTDASVIPIDAYSPLVAVHLNVLNTILEQDYLHRPSPWLWIPLYFLFLFGVGNAMLRVGISPMIPMGLCALLMVAGIAFASLWFANELVPVMMPELGLLFLSAAVPTRRFFGEEREKTRVKGAMRAYLSDKVMAKVLEHPDNLKLGGVKQEITIMFCDIRGFTSYCDERDPQETMDVLNEYMEEMTQVVFKYDGTIDKYIGDCIMAFWNAPELQPDHAQRAVRCAMEMRQALAVFKTRRVGKDRELFECGIGIHTGEALVGNMGSSLKRNYTAMGSTVNLAARLESLTKRLHERILISADTFQRLPDDLPITDRGEVEVPGFARAVHVYAVATEHDIASALEVGRTLAAEQGAAWEPAPVSPQAEAESKAE